MATFPQPGWYPDPHSTRKERLWNGRGWTEYWRELGGQRGEVAHFVGYLPSEEAAVRQEVLTHIDLGEERILDTKRGQLRRRGDKEAAE